MFITKKGKKFISVMAAFAILMTGLMILPKTTSAETEPTVSVLGATLRLDNGYNSDGTQAMRIAIKIDNADKVKACAIDLTVNGNTLRIATAGDTALTDGTGVHLIHKNLYSKNESDKSVVYAVTLNNIPIDNFSTPVDITGRIKMLDNTDLVWTESNNTYHYAQRSVDGIVSTLRDTYDTLHIHLYNGILYKGAVDWENKFKLTASDISGYITGSENDPNINPNELDFNSIFFPHGQGSTSCSKDENNNTVYKLISNSQDRFYIKLNNPVAVNESVYVTVYGTNSGSGSLKMGLYNVPTQENFDYDANVIDSKENIEFEKTYTLENKGSSEKDALIFAIGPNSSWDDITFTKIVVTSENDDTTVTPEPAPETSTSPEPTVTPEVTATPKPTVSPDTENSWVIDFTDESTRPSDLSDMIKFQYGAGTYEYTNEGLQLGGINDISNSIEQAFMIKIPDDINTNLADLEKIAITFEGENTYDNTTYKSSLVSYDSNTFDNFNDIRNISDIFGETFTYTRTNDLNAIGFVNEDGTSNIYGPIVIKKITITKITE